MSGADFERELNRLRHKTQLGGRRRQAFQKLLGEDYPSPRGLQEWQAYKNLRQWWSRPQIEELIARYGTDRMVFPGILGTAGPSLTEFLHDVGLLAEGKYARTLARSEMLELVAGKEAARGAAFIEGSKKSRSDALSRLIEQALPQLSPQSSATEVLWKVEEIDGGRVIDRIDPDDLTIEWHTPNGKDRTTTFKTFRNRLSATRKKIQ